MTKKLILIPVFIIFVAGLGHWFYQNHRTPSYTLSRQVRPGTTIFAFDLHNVVFNTDITKVIRLLWKDFFRYAPISVLAKPTTWQIIYQAMDDNLSIEYLFNQLKSKNAIGVPFKKLFSDIISAQDLNYQTIGLLFALKYYGYKLYILSNIWPDSLNQLYRKYPLLNDLFDGYYIPNEKSNYITKPDSRFYAGFRQYLEKQGQEDKQIIFVDNSRKNVRAATKEGLTAIEFNSIKNLIKFLAKEHVITSPAESLY